MAPVRFSAAAVLIVAALFVLPGAGVVGSGILTAAGSLRNPAVSDLLTNADVPAGAFAFVSNFEDHSLDGWMATEGRAVVTTHPNYLGEPVLLSSSARSRPQTDLAFRGFERGDALVSFQALINTGSSGTGFVGLVGPHNVPVALVGISGGTVWAGPNLGSLQNLAPVPNNAAQPAGWVYVAANVHSITPAGTTTPEWVMNVFVDQTDHHTGVRVDVPDAENYTGAILTTTHGTVAYTNLVFTTYQIPIRIPGYNPMDGYGQGSGLWVSLLPAFTTLTATETLDNWNTPEAGILSFQINAMNYIGTVDSTCHGFFQLGVDLDPGGYIAPWYVPGTNCVAHYFGHGYFWTGFPSPAGSQLTLTIRDDVQTASINFSIVDHSVGSPDRHWNDSIPYSGTLFFGTYTQIEYQPFSSYPIRDYFLNGSLDHMMISGGSVGFPRPLTSQYMLPFALDMPKTWNMGYYDDTIAGYQQVG